MALDSSRSGGSFGASFRATECPICMSVFNSTRTPLATPCGHTLCQPCAYSLADHPRKNKPRAFDCPMCREHIPSLSRLKVNYALLDLINQVRALTSSHHRSSSGPHLSRFLSINFTDLQLDEMLDSGAFGEVYRGRWRGNVVAVKIIRSKDLSPQAIESFHREVEVMNFLKHPNVVMLMAACKKPPRLCIVMEFVGGGSLYRVLHAVQYQLKDGEFKKLALDVCSGLQYLHSINIMHRDLKSKNVLLTTSRPPVAKLCDFGLSRMRLESATMTGHVGTAQWTAPEIINDSHYTFKADIYSLGMVLLEMVTNQVPFPGMHPMAILMAVGVKKKSPPIPSSVNLVLSSLIRQCVKWDAAERPLIPQVVELLENFKAVDSASNLCVADLAVKECMNSFHSLFERPVSRPDDVKEDIAAPAKLSIGTRTRSLSADGVNDLQLNADYALAAQLQEEEKREREELTAGDSYIARQLHYVEGAKAERGATHADVQKYHGIPFNPKQEVMSEMRSKFHGRKPSEESISRYSVSDNGNTKSESQSWQFAEYEPGEKPWPSETEPMLSSLVRQPSAPLAAEGGSDSGIQGSSKETETSSGINFEGHSDCEVSKESAAIGEKTSPEVKQQCLHTFGRWHQTGQDNKPGFFTRHWRQMSEILSRRVSSPTVDPKERESTATTPDDADPDLDSKARSPPFHVDGNTFLRVMASLKSMVPDHEVGWAQTSPEKKLLPKALSLPTNLFRKKGHSKSPQPVPGDVAAGSSDSTTGSSQDSSSLSPQCSDSPDKSQKKKLYQRIERSWTLGSGPGHKETEV